MTKDLVHYVRWRDACYHPDYQSIETIGEAIEIEEVGFLVKEMEDTVTLSIERHGPGEDARLTLTIPKVNIVEWRTFRIPRKAKLLWPKADDIITVSPIVDREATE